MDRTILIGGLDGGGDSRGALPLAFKLNKLAINTVFAGFVNAKTKDIREAEKITGALMKIYPSSSSPSIRFLSQI